MLDCIGAKNAESETMDLWSWQACLNVFFIHTVSAFH